MATSKNTSFEFEDYPTARDAAAAETARVSSLVYSIGHLSELLEDCVGEGSINMFPLATAIQALVESAQRHGDVVERALASMKEAGHV